MQTERVVSKDNTVTIGERSWQIEKSRFRSTLAGCTVTIHEHLDETISVRYGPHVIGRYNADGKPLVKDRKSIGKDGKRCTDSCGKGGAVGTVENPKPVFHRSHRPLEIPQKRRDSHFPTAAASAASFVKIKRKTRKPPSASRRGAQGAI